MYASSSGTRARLNKLQGLISLLHVHRTRVPAEYNLFAELFQRHRRQGSFNGMRSRSRLPSSLRHYLVHAGMAIHFVLGSGRVARESMSSRCREHVLRTTFFFHNGAGLRPVRVK